MLKQGESQVPAIVCNGYSRDPLMADFIKYGFRAVVPKPYEAGNLTEAIKRLLPKIRKT